MKKSILFIMLCFILSSCQNSKARYNNSAYNDKMTSSSYAAIKQNPWKFIATQINIDVPSNSRITTEKERLLRNSRHFESITIRSEPYVYYIIDQLQQNNIPTELALIPLIESAYDPLATSSSKAAGLWQFVPITAKEYGLKRNSNFDARRDLIESTNSAIALLQDLNARFDGDWLLTLAAYNAGEGRVKRAIQSNRAKGLATDFWSLNLPKHTMQYVPKVLAIIDIVKNSKQYGVSLPKFNYANSLVRIDISKKISLAKIAQYSGIPLDDLVSFNAGYLNKTINGPFHLLIPYSYAENLHQKLQQDNLVDDEIVELLDKPNNAVETANIKQNNNINDRNISDYVDKFNIGEQIIHLVKAGDNIYSIAQSYKVKINDILRWNNLQDLTVKEGDELTISLVKSNS